MSENQMDMDRINWSSPERQKSATPPAPQGSTRYRKCLGGQIPGSRAWNGNPHRKERSRRWPLHDTVMKDQEQAMEQIDWDDTLPPQSPAPPPSETALVAQTQALQLGAETPAEKMGTSEPSRKEEETPASEKKENPKPQKGKKSVRADEGKSSRGGIKKSSNRGNRTSRGGNCLLELSSQTLYSTSQFPFEIVLNGSMPAMCSRVTPLDTCGALHRPRPADWVDEDTVFWDGIRTVARLEARQRVEQAAAARRDGGGRRGGQNQRRRQQHNRRGRKYNFLFPIPCHIKSYVRLVLSYDYCCLFLCQNDEADTDMDYLGGQEDA
ncbi:unnamed protein product [Penicillium salamii]|nr:unnamed protein product [Penicillium salamii]CAG8057646.1 unnamed protein product [Penicillium salamii]